MSEGVGVRSTIFRDRFTIVLLENAANSKVVGAFAENGKGGQWQTQSGVAIGTARASWTKNPVFALKVITRSNGPTYG
jgi:hypothetical protein